MNFEQLVTLFHQTHQEIGARAARVVDTHLAMRNWLFGGYIIEYEQQGADRAEYGTRLLSSLAKRLKFLGIKGTGSTNLKLFRQFYIAYRGIGQTPSDLSETFFRIGQTLSDQSQSSDLSFPKAQMLNLMNSFTLGWSHYVSLLTISSPDERRFYEIEAAANQWSVRELERQIASSLFERLALSRDKQEIRRLAAEGQIVERAADLIKNPLVLEFLGLDERSAYSESELETAIIDKLESFLLELGKGFLFEARQKRFTFDNDHYFVDLVFYNRLLRCYVLIDLKRDKLTHQDLGQMQIHPVRYELPLRLHTSKQQRRKFLRRIHQRPQAQAYRTSGRACALDKKPTSVRTHLLRSLPKPSRRDQARKVSQNSVGKTLYQKPFERLSHGVNVNYFDRHVKLPDELPTIGIVLCHRKNDTLVELTLPEDANIFASKYQLYLPSKEELKAELEQITRDLDKEAQA